MAIEAIVTRGNGSKLLRGEMLVNFYEGKWQ